jgi:Fe-S cluster assembly protein SufD
MSTATCPRVSVSTVDRTDKRVGSALTPFDRISALAFGLADRALVVERGRRGVVTEPVR